MYADENAVCSAARIGVDSIILFFFSAELVLRVVAVGSLATFWVPLNPKP